MKRALSRTSLRRLFALVLSIGISCFITSTARAGNLLNDTFATLPAEVKSGQDLANAAFQKQVASLLADKGLSESVYGLVKGKIDEAVKKGEAWVRDGGVREAVQKELAKALDGKVAETDRQRILNLADKLCTVNADGGKGFVAALGTDGKDLAVSLAVNEMKKQLADAWPADVADSVNAMLDTIANGGTSEDVKRQLLAEVQKVIGEKIPYENAAKTVNGLLQDIVDGKALDTLDTLKNLGQAVGLDALRDVIAKNLDPEAAARLNALIDAYTQNGTQGLSEAALAEINALIDKYAPGATSANQLKGFVKGVATGTVTVADLKKTVTAVASDGAKALIDKSDLPPDVKEVAKKAIDQAGEGNWAGLGATVGDYVADYVEDVLGPGTGDAFRNIWNEIVTPGGDPWNAIVEQAPVIGGAIVEKVSAKVEKIVSGQIDKLIAKYPGLKSVLDRLGIDGKGIVAGVKNVLGVLFNAPDLGKAFTQLGKMAITFLKDIAAKLIDWAVEWALSWINNKLIPKAIDWASETLGKWADGTHNALAKKCLLCLQQKVQELRKGAVIKVNADGIGAKAIDKFDKWLRKTPNKPAQERLILEGSTR